MKEGFTLMETSPIVLIDLTSTAEILPWSVVSITPPLPRGFKIASLYKQSVNIRDCELACQQMPEMAPLRLHQIPDASLGDSGEQVRFSPGVPSSATSLSFPRTHPWLFLAHENDKPRSPHRGSMHTWQGIVKCKAEKVCSKSLPDF